MFTVRIGMHADCPAIAELIATWKPGSGRAAEDATLDYGFSYYVAVASDGKVIGFLQGMLDYNDESIALPGYTMPVAFILAMVVAPAYQKQGIGAALIRRFAREAAEAGLTFLALAADEGAGQEQRVQFFRNRGMSSLDPEQPLLVFGAPIADLLGCSENGPSAGR